MKSDSGDLLKFDFFLFFFCFAIFSFAAFLYKTLEKSQILYCNLQTYGGT